MLASYEQQMQFDPAANYSSNFDIAEARRVLREKSKQSKSAKAADPNMSNDEVPACDSPESDYTPGIQLEDDPMVRASSGKIFCLLCSSFLLACA
jgi:hypothetical protein